MFHKIKSVAPLPDYVLLVHFTDGAAKQYDMKPLLDRPGFSDLRGVPGLFPRACVDVGGYGVSWSDTVDISAEELWANGAAVVTPFTGLLSFSDATALWGLSESALRKAVSYRKLVEGVDAQKYGKQWLVTAAAMHREYGSPQ